MRPLAALVCRRQLRHDHVPSREARSGVSLQARAPDRVRRAGRQPDEDGAAAASRHRPVPHRCLCSRPASRPRAQPALPASSRPTPPRWIPRPHRDNARPAQCEAARRGRTRSGRHRDAPAPPPPLAHRLELRYASQLHADPIGASSTCSSTRACRRSTTSTLAVQSTRQSTANGSSSSSAAPTRPHRAARACHLTSPATSRTARTGRSRRLRARRADPT